jgi:hypothetical protein
MSHLRAGCFDFLGVGLQRLRRHRADLSRGVSGVVFEVEAHLVEAMSEHRSLHLGLGRFFFWVIFGSPGREDVRFDLQVSVEARKRHALLPAPKQPCRWRV